MLNFSTFVSWLGTFIVIITLIILLAIFLVKETLWVLTAVERQVRVPVAEVRDGVGFSSKGAKWKKSSARAAERREREANSGQPLPLPFPLLVARPRSPKSPRPEGEAADPGGSGAQASALAPSDDANVPAPTSSAHGLEVEIDSIDQLTTTEYLASDGESRPGSQESQEFPAAVNASGQCMEATTISVPKGTAVVVIYTATSSERKPSNLGLQRPSEQSASSVVDRRSDSHVATQSLNNVQIVVLPDAKHSSVISVHPFSDGKIKGPSPIGDLRKINLATPFDANIHAQQLTKLWRVPAMHDIPHNHLVMTSFLPSGRCVSAEHRNNAPARCVNQNFTVIPTEGVHVLKPPAKPTEAVAAPANGTLKSENTAKVPDGKMPTGAAEGGALEGNGIKPPGEKRPDLCACRPVPLKVTDAKSTTIRVTDALPSENALPIRSADPVDPAADPVLTLDLSPVPVPASHDAPLPSSPS